MARPDVYQSRSYVASMIIFCHIVRYCVYHTTSYKRVWLLLSDRRIWDGSTVAESSRAKDCPTGDCAEYQRDLQRLYSFRDTYQYHLDSLELVYEVKWILAQLHLSGLQQAAYRLAILLRDMSGNETL
jgi:hypothetical protein